MKFEIVEGNFIPICINWCDKVISWWNVLIWGSLWSKWQLFSWNLIRQELCCSCLRKNTYIQRLFNQMNKPKYNTPAPGERCAYPQKRVVKRAALLFDRIYVPPWRADRDSTPSYIKFDVPNITEYFNILFEKLKQPLILNNPKLKDHRLEAGGF